jgi:PAS domain S-box-containing protein
MMIGLQGRERAMAEADWAGGPEILDLVHDSIIVRDLDGTIVQWNAAAETQYGWSRAEAIGRKLCELLPCDADGLLGRIEAELLAAGSWEGELTRCDRAGRRLRIDVRWSTRRGADGAPRQIVETGRDVTEQRASEAAMRLGEYRFRNLFEAMAVAFWEIDFNPVGPLLLPLREAGIDDLRAHLLARPELVREMMAATRVLDVNAKTLELFGAAAKEEIVGQGTERFWPDESLPVFVESLVATLEKQPGLVSETVVLDLHGNPLDVMFTVAWSPESRQQGVLLIGLIDIGDRKRAFDAMERSERRYRSLFTQMPIALWELESRDMREMFDALVREGVEDFGAWLAEHPDRFAEARALLKVTEANDQALELFGGADHDSLLPLMPALWTNPHDFAEAAAARLAGKRSYTSEAAIRTVDGGRKDIVFGVAFADPADADSANLVGAIDISDRKSAIAELTKSELKYRNLFQHMPIALAQLDVCELVGVLARLRREGVTDLDAYMDAHPDFLGQMLEIMKVEQVNDHMVELLGGSDPAEFSGPIARFWRGNEHTVRRSLCARYAGAESYSEETRIRAPDGRSIDIFYTSAFPAALNDMGIGLVGIIDIRSRLEAERMLQQVQADFAHAARVATLGELSASIAHEINQPLAAIATNGEASLRWLDRAEPDVGEARKLAARMVADARRAAEVIRHIRAMATRQSAGRERVSVNDLIEETLGFLQRDLQAKDVAVEFAPAEALPPVEADRTQLQQVLVNLAVNAEQAMVQHDVADRRLMIRTGTAGNGCISVEVEDSGPGVPAELAARLFDSFVTTKPNGLGIGLSICRSIIESHGGRISVANGGTGARFTFTLPVAPTEPAAAAMPLPA